ncbi:MAG: pyridoxal phosphate-dependent aminotransferase family protein [Chitinophagaceae bacterium]
MADEDFLISKLEERKQQNAFRQLRLPDGKIDFCSNDYLGIVKNGLIEKRLFSKTNLAENSSLKTGSTGSRLLAGNYALIEETESKIARFHVAAAGLIFNSGYDANTGLLSCIPQRDDTIIYDFLSHASLRDGIRLCHAQSFSFRHNDMEDLERKLRLATGNIFVITESVFSMDGDKAPLQNIIELCEQFTAHLVVDEAHATGVVGERGQGLVQLLGLQNRCFARIHTFGKACGAHGAIVLGSEHLRNYLVNFSRAFIFTTALPEASLAAISTSYDIFPELNQERKHLDQLVLQFQQGKVRYEILQSETPVQVIIIPGNNEVKKEAQILQDAQLDVRPILYPTVARGAERLRIVLHSFNSSDEVAKIMECLY